MELHGLEQIAFNRPERCDACGGDLEYKGIGRYLCINCGKELLDDYGVIKEYFRTHGATPLLTVAKETGISKQKIRYILEGNYTEIPPANSPAAGHTTFGNNYHFFK